MLNPGDVILAEVQFTDSFETKRRPAVVLFEEENNVIVAGVTSNKKMKGIPLTQKEGVVKDSVIKLNYIFTVSNDMIIKPLFKLSKKKKKQVYEQLMKKLNALS